MSNIKEIKLHNFKAFYTGAQPDSIDLESKNLLLYGENGSGKSSIYWALYTLFQSETKSNQEIEKYFSPTHNEQLINYQFLVNRDDITFDADGNITNPNSIGVNSEIEVILEDNTSLKLNSIGKHETVPNKILDLHRRSDFITHRLLVNFYNFRNSKGINLWEVLVQDFFPFLISDTGLGNTTLWQEYKFIQENLPFKLDLHTGTFKRSRSDILKNNFIEKIRLLNRDIIYWIERLNQLSNLIYINNFKNNDGINIHLEYTVPLRYEHYAVNIYVKDGIEYRQGTGFAKLNEPFIKLILKREHEDGSISVIHRPQAYLNEAKMTQIALAIRFSLLDDTIKPPYPGQFLALDDLLISLDMSNRDIILDVILNKYAPKYKIYLFTHELEFFNFCKFKINQNHQKNNWLVKEIYLNEDDKKVELIDSDLDYLSKSKKYYGAKDYVAAAFYLRKDLENFVKGRIPDVLKKIKDNEFHNLDHYWNIFVDIYKKLGVSTSKDIHDWFKQTKLVILNPSAHANLSHQIFKNELEKAYEFREKIEILYQPNNESLIIAEKTAFIFKHPDENYIFEFYFKTDFIALNLNGNINELLPKAIVTNFEFNDVKLWDFQTLAPYDNNFINNRIIDKKIKFDRMLLNLKQIASLAITDDMFYSNTTLKHSKITLDTILKEFVIS